MKILFICCHERYLCKNKTYFDIVNNYRKKGKHKVSIIFTNSNFNKHSCTKLNPDVVIFFDIDTIRYGSKFRFAFVKPVFVCSLDYFYMNDCINCPYIQDCTGLITFPTQSKIMDSYKKIFTNKKFLSFNGRFINTSIYKNYNKTKKYDILVYGTRNYNNKIENHSSDKEYIKKWTKYYKRYMPEKYLFYPARDRITHLLIKNSNKYKLRILESCGSLGAPKYVNNSLSELINESWLTLCTCSRADILMDKYCEIASSYSGILGNIPSDYKDRFQNNIVEVTEWMSDEEILSTIDKALEDKEKLKTMINKTADIVKNNFDLNCAVVKMDNVFDEISRTL